MTRVTDPACRDANRRPPGRESGAGRPGRPTDVLEARRRRDRHQGTSHPRSSFFRSSSAAGRASSTTACPRAVGARQPGRGRARHGGARLRPSPLSRPINALSRRGRSEPSSSYPWCAANILSGGVEQRCRVLQMCELPDSIACEPCTISEVFQAGQRVIDRRRRIARQSGKRAARMCPGAQRLYGVTPWASAGTA